jgi:hypothetical protein
MKTMLITFFDIKGIVHFEFIAQGQTVNQAYYVDILKRLRVQKKGQNFGSCSISQGTLSSSFWPKNESLKWNTHPDPLIWLRMTSGCFQI